MTHRRGLAIATVVAWLISLAAPTFHVDAGEASVTYYGYQVLWVGVLSPLAGSVAYFANVPLAIVVVRLWKGRSPGKVLPLAALALAATAFLPLTLFGANEGVSGPAKAMLGAYIWLTAFIGPAALAAVALRGRLRGVRGRSAPLPDKRN